MRFLAPRPDNAPAPSPTATETAAVRQIVARLEALPPDRARYLAMVAYVLARSANADMDISEVELDTIQQVLVEAGLDESQALLVAEMAKLQERTSGGTSDYQVTRAFRDIATEEERIALLDSCYRVAAAERGIGSEETAVLDEIAREFDLDRDQARKMRAKFADKVSARFQSGQ
jgi:uncharacterized tellurite resistance protein B-like protein